MLATGLTERYHLAPCPNRPLLETRAVRIEDRHAVLGKNIQQLPLALDDTVQ